MPHHVRIVLLFFLTVLLLSRSVADERSQETQPEPASDEVGVSLADLVGTPAATSTDEPPMTTVVGLLFGYSAMIVCASILGGWLPSKIELTHTRMQTIISLVGGLMLGIGVFHLLPHAVVNLHSAHAASRWMMLGIVAMFILMRLFHFHNHEPVGHDSTHVHCSHDEGHNVVHSEQREKTGEKHNPAECHTHGHSHGISWLGLTIGLSFHTLLDGLALGASVYSDACLGGDFWLFGFGTFLAILFHKPLDAVSITSLMLAGGWSKGARNAVNIGFATMCPIGAMLVIFALHGSNQLAGYQQEITGAALAFSAGVFLCISLSDLLPEMEFHSHNKVQLTSALSLGIAIAWLIAVFHPAHL